MWESSKGFLPLIVFCSSGVAIAAAVFWDKNERLAVPWTCRRDGSSARSLQAPQHLKTTHDRFDNPFTTSLEPLFSPRPVLGAPLSSYLEVALINFIDRQTDRHNNNLRVSNIRVSNRTLIYNLCPKSALTWPSRHSRHRHLCRFYRSRINR